MTSGTNPGQGDAVGPKTGYLSAFRDEHIRFRLIFTIISLVGVVLVLVSLVIAIASVDSEKIPAWFQQASLNVGAGLLAAVVLAAIWEMFGGDAASGIANDIRAIRGRLGSTDTRPSGVEGDAAAMMSVIVSEVKAMTSASPLISDLIRYDIGLTRAWPMRKTFTQDPASWATWRERILTSRKTDFLSISLWTNWTQDEIIQDNLRRAAIDGKKIRILLYEPGSEIQMERAELEHDDGHMVHEIAWTVGAIRRINDEIRQMVRGGALGPRLIEVKYTSKAHHAIHMVSCDDAMLVSFYLSNVDGTFAPTIEVRAGSTLCARYSEQYEQLFGKGTSADV